MPGTEKAIIMCLKIGFRKCSSHSEKLICENKRKKQKPVVVKHNVFSN